MAVFAGVLADVYVSASPSINVTNELATDSGDHTNYTMATHKYWDKRQILTVQEGNDEFQSVTITGGPTGGTFTLTFGGNTTATLAIAATAAQVQTALQNLASIGVGGCLVTGANGGPWSVEFTAAKGNAGQLLMTQANTFTGGSSPTVSIVRTLAGAAFATVTNYTFEYVEGIVTFAVAQAATKNVRVSTGYFFNVTELTDCSEWNLDIAGKTEDTTSFQAPANYRQETPTVKEASAKISSFRVDDTMEKELTNLLALVLYTNKAANTRFSMYAYITNVNPKGPVKGVLTQEVSFMVDGDCVYYAS